MIFRKTKNLRFNMGHYEHQEVYAVVEVNTDSAADRDDLIALGVDPRDLDAVMDFIDDRIADFVEPDVQSAFKTTANDDSFVFPYIKSTTNK